MKKVFNFLLGTSIVALSTISCTHAYTQEQQEGIVTSSHCSGVRSRTSIGPRMPRDPEEVNRARLFRTGVVLVDKDVVALVVDFVEVAALPHQLDALALFGVHIHT